MGNVTTVNGQHAVPLTGKVLDGTLYVTDASTPQVLQLVNSFAGTSAKLNFNVGAAVTVSRPPTSQSVDGTRLRRRRPRPSRWTARSVTIIPEHPTRGLRR